MQSIVATATVSSYKHLVQLQQRPVSYLSQDGGIHPICYVLELVLSCGDAAHPTTPLRQQQRLEADLRTISRPLQPSSNDLASTSGDFCCETLPGRPQTHPIHQCGQHTVVTSFIHLGWSIWLTSSTNDSHPVWQFGFSKLDFIISSTCASGNQGTQPAVASKPTTSSISTKVGWMARARFISINGFW